MNFKKINFVALLFTALVSSGITFVICQTKKAKSSTDASSENKSAMPASEQACAYSVSRLGGYKFVRPLVQVKSNCEAPQYQGIKSEIETKINEYKKSSQLISASVFFRDFTESNWFSINDTEEYLPGSLIKVIGMITYLKMEEANPGVLNKKLTFNNPTEFIPVQTFDSKHVELGKTYTVKELLEYMIAYSDNNATYLLNKNVDLPLFKKIFSDLGIPPPNFEKSDFRIRANDFSTLMIVIYNASYLTIEHSEFAAELLAKCDFKEGFSKSVPANVPLAHKFGEMGDSNTRQLHESGIFYFDKKPYLLTVLTKGYDVKKMPEVLSTISKIVYDGLNREQYAHK